MEIDEVETVWVRGRWVNRVVGEEDLPGGFASREQAVEEGRRLAARLGATHRIVERPDHAVDAEREYAPARGLPRTTDDEGRPLDNPSG